MVKIGSGLLSTGSLLLPEQAPFGALSTDIEFAILPADPRDIDPFHCMCGFVSGDRGAQVRNDRYAAQRHYDSLDESDVGAWNGSFRFSKRPPSADNHEWKGGVRDRRGQANGSTEEKSGYQHRKQEE